MAGGPVGTWVVLNSEGFECVAGPDGLHCTCVYTHTHTHVCACIGSIPSGQRLC